MRLLQKLLFIHVFLWLSVPVSWCWGIAADEVLVVVNRRMSGAEKVARYYMAKRNIPANRLLLISLTLAEVIDRDEYKQDLAQPVENKIRQLAPAKISSVVLIHGIPLKVRPPALSLEEEEQLRILKKEKVDLGLLLNSYQGNDAQVEELDKQIKTLTGTSRRAAVDSELALVLAGDYPLAGWIENPYFIGFQGREPRLKKRDVLLVSRLDGPDLQTVYRIINDSLAAEQQGLQGRAYFDARWPPPEKSALSGYALYDNSLHKAAEVVGRRMSVTVESTGELFAIDSCPQAALYSGWYSLGNYRDSFEWVKGSVGYHIASAECASLKKTSSRGWCLQMLKNGVAATIGPVYEPYVQGFPLPEVFFAALIEGYMNLGESYLVSLPYLSWQMVLVGDPLYKPFTPIENGD